MLKRWRWKSTPLLAQGQSQPSGGDRCLRRSEVLRLCGHNWQRSQSCDRSHAPPCPFFQAQALGFVNMEECSVMCISTWLPTMANVLFLKYPGVEKTVH